MAAMTYEALFDNKKVKARSNNINIFKMIQVFKKAAFLHVVTYKTSFFKLVGNQLKFFDDLRQNVV